MQVGVQLMFQAYGYDPPIPDSQVMAEEMVIAVLADELGFDSVWPVEHHFTDYSLCPDNVVFLANVAARTKRIGLATGAVIIPWNDPLRVAEKISMLDQLAPGRAILGMGRGLARREFDWLQISMDEARGRFDEGARMVLDALQTGYMESDGQFYKRHRTPIRPVPTGDFSDRVYCVANSRESVDSAARLGSRMMLFPQRTWKEHAVTIQTYRELFEKYQERPAPPPLICDYIYCDQDSGRAEAGARRHIVSYLASVLDHYELAGDHLREAKGYETYGQLVPFLQKLETSEIGESYLGLQAWGTPDQILERLRARRELIGLFDLSGCFRYAGIGLAEAERNMRLFTETVLPVLRSDPAFTTTTGDER